MGLLISTEDHGHPGKAGWVMPVYLFPGFVLGWVWGAGGGVADFHFRKRMGKNPSKCRRVTAVTQVTRPAGWQRVGEKLVDFRYFLETESTVTRFGREYRG